MNIRRHLQVIQTKSVDLSNNNFDCLILDFASTFASAGSQFDKALSLAGAGQGDERKQ